MAPQIGVLCIDVAVQLLDMFPERDIRSYIPSSYVKFLEGAGAETVPVWIGKGRAYYKETLSKLNGLLIPGGAVFFTKSEREFSNDCVQASKYIYEYATEQNDQGIYFPIWGTCLGFQLLIYHSAKGEDAHEIRCISENMNCCLPVLFEPDFRESKMLANLPETLESIMETEPFGCHKHHYYITRESLTRFRLDGEWRILATNRNTKDFEFITLIEHKSYPFYGSQVHFERNAYELIDDIDACLHTQACMEASQYYAKFFISECEKCPNHFDSHAERMRYSIKNFNAESTAHAPRPRWLECYLFGAEPEYP